jgi:hypothetical protein
MGSKSKNRQQAKKETNMQPNPYEDVQPIVSPATNAPGDNAAGDAGDTSEPKGDGAEGVEGVEGNKPADTSTDAVAEQPAEPVAEAAPAPAPVEIPVGFAKALPVLDDPYQLPLSCAPASQIVIQELKDYIAAMSAKIRMPNDQGGQIQMNLYHTLMQIINTRPEDFDAVFSLAMKLIHDNLKGVFSDENMHRYTPHVSMPSKLMAHFRYLLSALTALAAPQTRQLALRQVNLAQAFQHPRIKEDARQRVFNYFNV